MAIDMLEGSDLSALSPSRLDFRINQGSQHFNFIAPAAYVVNRVAARSDRKKMAQKASQSEISESNIRQRLEFKNRIDKVYDALKSKDKNAWSVAVSNLNKENGIDAAYQVVKAFGTPYTKPNFAKHNDFVNIYLKYYLPSEGAINYGCDRLSDMLSNIQIEINSLDERQSAGIKSAILASTKQALTARKSDIQKAISMAKCEVKKIEEEQQKATAETLSQLEKSTEVKQQSPNITKYVAYGVGAIILIVGISAALKK